jgi:hypothetical protein
MRGPVKRLRLRTVAMVALVIALVATFCWRQHRLDRLRAALALYKSRSHESVIAKLNRPAPNLDWPGGTPLTEVVAFIQQETAASKPFLEGVPVIIDEREVTMAGKSLSTPVGPPLAGPSVSLREKLQSALKPLGLACHVNDGTIVITSESTADLEPGAYDKSLE